MLKLFFFITAGVSLWSTASVFAAVNVAVIAPRAGDYKVYGDELISGARIAVDELNSNGGLEGEKVNLVIVDDQCDDRLAVSTAQMMAVNNSPKDKMSLVIGPYCSNSFSQVADIYAKAGIFQIIPTKINTSNAGGLHKGLVKLLGYKEQQAQDFFNYYQSNFVEQKVALVYDGDRREIVEIAAAIQEAFRKGQKADWLKTYNFSNFQNLDFLAEEILNHNIRIAYIMGSSEQIAKLSKLLKEEHKHFAVFTNRYQSEASYQKIMGDLAEGSYFLALPSLKDNPDFTETLVKMRLLGVEPEGLSVYSYSAFKLWEELVDKADSFSYSKLAETLNGNSFETAWGEMMFTNGNPNRSPNYGIYQLRSGEYTQVY